MVGVYNKSATKEFSISVEEAERITDEDGEDPLDSVLDLASEDPIKFAAELGDS